MEDTIVSFETAKLAKEKGVPQQCTSSLKTYYDNKGKLNTNYYGNSYDCDIDILAPIQSLLQKWLREKHSIHITIFSSSQKSWMYRITKKYQELLDGIYGEDFYTYEEALEDALYKSLKLIKTK